MKKFANTHWGHLRGPLAMASVFVKLVRALCWYPLVYGLLSRSGTTAKPDLLDWLMLWTSFAVALLAWFIDHVLDADGNGE